MLFTKRRCKIGNAKKKIFFVGLFLVVLLTLASCSKIQQLPSTAKGTSSLKGFISDLKINGESFQIGSPIIVTGVFNAQADGNYYIEIGLDKSSKALVVLKSSQSACDQSIHYAGVWFNNAKTGNSIPFVLSIKDYGETGKYNVVGGVYSRCGVGSDVASITPISVTITSSQPQLPNIQPPTTSNTPPSSVTTPSVACTPSGSFTELWIRRYGSKDANDNSQPRVIGRFQSNAPCPVTY